MSKTETSDILNQISKKWNRNLPKIKNIKVHYVDDNAQILVGVNFKILRIEDELGKQAIYAGKTCEGPHGKI